MSQAIVEMKKVFCSDCMKYSLINPKNTNYYLCCWDIVQDLRYSLVRQFRTKLRGVQCPVCEILHPGKNIGAPLCGGCHKKERERVLSSFTSQSGYQTDSYQVDPSDYYSDSPTGYDLYYDPYEDLQDNYPFDDPYEDFQDNYTFGDPYQECWDDYSCYLSDDYSYQYQQEIYYDQDSYYQQDVQWDQIYQVPNTSQIIQSLKQQKVPPKLANVQCSICLETFKEGKVFIQLKCKHPFHEHCIVKWLKSNNKCPLCRKVLNCQSYQWGQNGGS